MSSTTMDSSKVSAYFFHSLLQFSFVTASMGAVMQPRIIGGENATIEEFPYMVSMYQCDALLLCREAFEREGAIIARSNFLIFLFFDLSYFKM